MAVFLIQEPKCVFIHIPKTGGATIRHGIFEGRVKGPRQGFVPDNWLKHFKFAFVRNPYDRVVSAWKMFAGGMQNSVWEQPDDRAGITLDSFLDIASDSSIPFDGQRMSTEEKIRHHAIPQTHEFNCLQYADFIGRFENFQADFEAIAKRIGFEFKELPHWNKTERDRDFMKYFNSATKSRVERLYQEDFSRLNYPVASS